MTPPETPAPADAPQQGGPAVPPTDGGNADEVVPAAQSSPPPAARAPLVLRSLRPTYVEDQHQTYVDLLKTEILKKGPEAPRNIALTGHYGSGKSSVLTKTQQVLEKQGIKVVNLSLPSLGIGDGRIKEDGDKARDKTNLIQKEIVKQLLYRRKPSATPASRYNRIDTFHTGRALGSAAAVGLAATGFAFMIEVPAKVRDAAPAEFWTWIDVNVGNVSGLIQWLSLAIVFGLALLASMWVQRLLQQRVRISELGAGPAKVTLSDSTSSFFDEYLDEIVYFFQTSKTTVVIFEDLDRFEDPHIFETLRELNALLNNADQTGRKPIRFIYAIRDSIFEQLDVADEGPSNLEASTSPPQNDVADTRRLTSTNRTKFFDLVIPMVPFISHRTSRDLIREQLSLIADDRRPGNDVVDVVAAHLTDMRLIKNICNEYEVFQQRILAAGGLKELTADRLFASIVYKNLYLTDYEKIRDGESALDAMYEAYRRWVEHRMHEARTVERRIRVQLSKIDEIASRSEDLGSRLKEVLEATCFSAGQAHPASITLDGTTFQWAELATEDFWRQLISSKSELSVPNNVYPYHPHTVTFKGVETIVGYSLAPDDWNADARATLRAQLESASEDQRTVQQASIAIAIADKNRKFTYEGAVRSFGEVVRILFSDAGVVEDLLRAGHIDENFTLYVTQFPGQAMTAKAMNFILKAVQPDVMILDYRFGESHESGVASIQSVIDAEESRLISGSAIFNIEIFDFLLARNSQRLDDPIRRLASGADSDLKFLDAYMTSGRSAESLVRRLTSIWPGIFNYLLQSDLGDCLREMLSEALGAVSADVSYAVNSEDADAMTLALPKLSVVRSNLSPDRAVVVAKTVERMGIEFGELKTVAQPLLDEIVNRSLYPVTIENLVAIYGDRDQVALDQVKTAGRPEVYLHVLNHLDAYLNQIEGAADVSSVADPAQFVVVLEDVRDVDTESLEEVARKASEQCLVSDIDDLDSSCWPAIARAHRFVPSVHNVSQYIAQYNLDEDLAALLATAGAIDVPVGAAQLEQLALQIVNAETIEPETALHLLSSLPLESGPITAADVREERQVMLPALVTTGAVADTSDAYASLGAGKWEIKRELIAASVNFPAYMSGLAFSPDELSELTSGPVSDEIMAVLLNEIETFAPKLGKNAAAAIANWAFNKRREPGGETIAVLADRGGPDAARPILRLLGAESGTIDVEYLKSSLNALGAPFSQVTSLGWDRPRLDAYDGVFEVLTRLQSEGIVSSFERDSRRQTYKVHKKRSSS